jgi:hypothetical protein
VALPILFGGYSTAYAITDGVQFYPISIISSVANFSGECENYPSITDLRWLLTSTLNNGNGSINSGAVFAPDKTCADISPFDLMNYGSAATQNTIYYLSLYTSFSNYLSNESYGYFTFYFNGTNWTSTSTAISKIYSFSYSTTTATANVQGYWESTTTPYITQQLHFWQYSNTLGREAQQTYTATTTGTFNFSFYFLDPYSFISSSTATTTPSIFSNFTLNASLDQYDETNYVFPYGGTIITNLDATSTTISTAQYNASDFISSPRALALYPEYECGITSLTGCFKNAIIWAFYPTQEALDNFSGLFTLIQTKAPIGYFYMTKDSISGLSATSTKAFDIIIPSSLKTYIFNPFDTGIAGILWLFFIFNFYKRLKTITI